MDGDVVELIKELKALRRGRALYARHIGERVGPMLCLACGVADGDTPGEIRKKVTNRIQALAGGLPEDLRLAVLAAFAVHPDAGHHFYQDRVRWVAAKITRDERTARRRIDEAIERLAELAAAPVTRRRAGGAHAVRPLWRVEELKVALVLDRQVPEAFEFRRIVSEEDGLSELDLSLTLTVPPGWSYAKGADRELMVNVIYGGTLVPRAREAKDRFAFALELPTPLGRLANHEYALHYLPGDAKPMEPHYVCVLRQPCDVFDLRVRFAKSKPPKRIWRLDGAFQRDLDDPVPSGNLLTLDEAGELHVKFQHPKLGLTYGVRWEP